VVNKAAIVIFNLAETHFTRTVDSWNEENRLGLFLFLDLGGIFSMGGKA